MDIVDRIQALVDEKGLSIAALERNTGLSNVIIKKWKKQSHSCDRVITIANYLNTSIEYLILGTVETKGLAFDVQQLLDYYNRLDKMEKGMVLGKAETLAELAAERAAKERAAEQAKKTAKPVELAADGQPEPDEPELCTIIYYDYPASAGTGLFLDETTSEEITIFKTPKALRATFAIPIEGDSMEPEFSDEDIVLVESCPCVSRGEIGIFLLDGEAFIKEFGGDCLISYNKKKYDPIMLKNYSSRVCLGRVLGKAEIIK